MNTDKAFQPLPFDGPEFGLLGAAQTVDELGDSLQAACDRMGIERYLILRFVGISRPRLAQIVHNADDDGTAYIEDLAKLSRWSVVHEMRKFGRPTTFGADAPIAAPAGFGRGAAALSPKNRSSCIAILCGDGLNLRDDDVCIALMSMAAIMAAQIHDSLAAIQARECPLTKQELQCLARAMAGETAKETARNLGLGVRTVEEYLARARKRLDANNSMAAGITAIDNGWLSLDQVRRLSA